MYNRTITRPIDVGAELLRLGIKILPAHFLYRTGLEGLALIPSIGAKTILGLRSEPSEVASTAFYIHHPFPKECRKYDGLDPLVLAWLYTGIDRITRADSPYLVHCAQGIDRTGMFIGALLAVLDVPRKAIVQEYGRSVGGNVEPINRFLNDLSIRGMLPMMRYKEFILRLTQCHE